MLELALRLRLLHDTTRMGVVRTDLKQDLTGTRRLHSRLMLEVAALGLQAGHTVGVEVGDPAVDVVLNDTLRVEAFVIGIDQKMGFDMDRIERFSARINDIRRQLDVAPVGDLGDLSDEEAQGWLAEFESIARRVQEEGAEITFRHPAGEIRVVPGHLQQDGDTFSLPGGTPKGWLRVADKLREKTEQARKSGANWLRVDLQDGTWQFHPWAQLDLPAKVAALTPWQTLHSDGSLDGVVFSSGCAFAQGSFKGESCRTPNNAFGLRRLITPSRVRESIVIPFTAAGATAAWHWVELYDLEPLWMDWALSRAGLPPWVKILKPQP
jgi:hypothetical protein